MGIGVSDIVFLHSGLIGLGMLEGGPDIITEAFDEVLKEGALIIPTFSYSWCKGEPFDAAKSECLDMGSYAKDAWKKKRFWRSDNPNFSVAALENSCNRRLIERLFQCKNTCFGRESVFDNIYNACGNRNGHILLLGGAHNDVVFRCTFIHYVEEKVGVPYRYIKRFFDPLDDSRYVEQLVRFLSRDEYISVKGKDDNTYTFPIEDTYRKLGEDLRKNGIIRIRPFAYSQSRMASIRRFCDFLEQNIRQDPNYILGMEQQIG
jgi:aminoglycoside N3'-acetyltransferase